MRRLLLPLFCGLLMLAGLACHGQQSPREAAGGAKGRELPARPGRDVPSGAMGEARLELSDPHYEGKIAEIQANGSARIALEKPGWVYQHQSGRYLAIVDAALPRRPQEFLAWGDVRKEPQQNVLEVRLSPAKGLKAGQRIALYQPKATRETPSALAYVIPDQTILRREAIPPIAQSRLNVRQIAMAMHRFHGEYNCFPPAVLRGPDGQPWHSWRVLILPYLNEQALYDEYRLDEPWDSPRNRKLLARMPDVYSDPAFGKQTGADERGYAHYAVVTTTAKVPPSAFTVEGLQLKKLPAILPGEGGRRNHAHLSDGVSRSPLVGAVGPEAEIPWTKPQDIELTPDFPVLGEPGSFATPYEVAGRRLAVLGFMEGSLHLVPDDISRESLRNLLTVTDHIHISEQEVPHINSGGVHPKWLLTIKSAGTGAAATLVCDAGEGMAQPVTGNAKSAR
jgi:hypothetical protein